LREIHMESGVSQDSEPGSQRPWWREPEVALLILVVAVAYFLRMGDVTLRGEETRRAQVAYEMIQRGDWIVPREQGHAYMSRPPLQNWLIALSTLIFGSWDPWVIRFHSVLAMLLTTLLVYGYSRTCLSRVFALVAAVAFATLGQMFEIGYQAETEMTFIALVSSSLLLWHWGMVKGWPAARTWTVGYVLMSLGFLCKGPQAPVYFLTSVCAYLVLTGQWRRLFTPAHLAGASIGVVVVLCWMIPCALSTDWAVVKGIVLNNTATRMMGWTIPQVLFHLIQFPLEMLGGTLPWSPLLLGFASPALRRALGPARPQALFLALCLVLAFPTCWIPPGASTRYFTPLFPCVAILVGIALECTTRMEVSGPIQPYWRWYVQFLSGSMAATAVLVVVAAWFLAGHPRLGNWVEQVPIAYEYGGLFLVLAMLVYKGRHGSEPAQVRGVVWATAAFMVLLSTGLLTNVRVRGAEDQVSAMARLKEQLPPGYPLLSFGHIHSNFAFYYGQPITALPLQPAVDDFPADDHFIFCFDSEGGWRPDLPFAWDELAVISMDRNHHDIPEYVVVVGRPRRTGNR
jgi:4-amino-4-deoxy-L-arabinose transferase-like glycosyltransferase